MTGKRLGQWRKQEGPAVKERPRPCWVYSQIDARFCDSQKLEACKLIEDAARQRRQRVVEKQAVCAQTSSEYSRYVVRVTLRQTGLGSGEGKKKSHSNSTTPCLLRDYSSAGPRLQLTDF